jgi:hypothetical protein
MRTLAILSCCILISGCASGLGSHPFKHTTRAFTQAELVGKDPVGLECSYNQAPVHLSDLECRQLLDGAAPMLRKQHMSRILNKKAEIRFVALPGENGKTYVILYTQESDLGAWSIAVLFDYTEKKAIAAWLTGLGEYDPT